MVVTNDIMVSLGVSDVSSDHPVVGIVVVKVMMTKVVVTKVVVSKVMMA